MSIRGGGGILDKTHPPDFGPTQSPPLIILRGALFVCAMALLLSLLWCRLADPSCDSLRLAGTLCRTAALCRTLALCSTVALFRTITLCSTSTIALCTTAALCNTCTLCRTVAPCRTTTLCSTVALCRAVAGAATRTGCRSFCWLHWGHLGKIEWALTLLCFHPLLVCGACPEDPTNTPQPRRDFDMVPTQGQSGKGHQQTARQSSCEQRKKGWHGPNQGNPRKKKGGGFQSFRPTHPDPPPIHPLQPLGPGTLTWCGGMVGSPQRERTGTGGQPRCRGSAMLSRSSTNSR